MTEREAQELVRMIESNWRFDLGQARALWRDALIGYDAELGLKAIAYLSKNVKRIDLQDLVSVLRMFSRPDPSRPGLPSAEGKRGVQAPEWVWVWGWARFMRNPRNVRAFPQEGANAHPDSLMSMEEYEKLRDEWVAAGSPKAEHPIPAARRRDASHA